MSNTHWQISDEDLKEIIQKTLELKFTPDSEAGSEGCKILISSILYKIAELNHATKTLITREALQAIADKTTGQNAPKNLSEDKPKNPFDIITSVDVANDAAELVQKAFDIFHNIPIDGKPATPQDVRNVQYRFLDLFKAFRQLLGEL